MALDGITVMVNSASSIECLTYRRPLRDLRTRVGWDRLDDRRQRAVEGGRRRRHHARPGPRGHRPGEESGTYDAFIDLAGIEDTAIENGVAEDDAAALRGDYQSSAERQRDHPGHGGQPERDRIRRGSPSRRRPATRCKEVAVDAGDGCVAPTSGHHRRRQLPVVPVAVHLSERRDGRRGRSRQGVRRLLPDRGRTRRPRSRRRSTSRSPADRQDAPDRRGSRPSRDPYAAAG